MDSKLILKIAGGIVLGGALLFIARVAIVGTGLTYIHDKASETIHQISTNAIQQSQAVKDRAAAEVRAKEEQRLAQLREQEDQARREQEKEQAFFDWYKAPAGCEHWDSDAEMVRCTNHGIRARREFEQVWAKRSTGPRAAL